MSVARVALALCLVLAGGCKKQHKAPPEDTVPAMSADEIKRSEDACKAYVDKACACTAPGAAKQCELAKPLPEAIRIQLEVAASPDSKPDVVRSAYGGVRKAVKERIEQTAKLPSAGCP